MTPVEISTLYLWFKPLVISFLGVLSASIVFYHNYDYAQEKIRVQTAGPIPDSFDFIVVGAGSAGAVVANRLSREYSVLLLEAGGEPFPLSSIPAAALTMVNRPHIDWGYKTVPQNNSCLALNNQQSYWPRGKALGGTSNLNYMMYLRGHHQDFDNWAKITDDPIWNYDSVLEYYKKHENLHEHDPKWEVDPKKYHVEGGDITISLSSESQTLAQKFINAGMQLFNFPYTDVNSKFEDAAITRASSNKKHGIRFGTKTAFIDPIRDTRKTLSVQKFAHVTKVLINDKKETIGVEYEQFGERKIAKCEKEVILSAGAIGTPQILMLSGIGPQQHLKDIGISVKKDLPVGQNLQDHISIWLGPFTINKSLSIDFTTDVLNPSNVAQYLTQGTGPLSTTASEATAQFVSSYGKKNAGEENWPDLQWILSATSTDVESSQNFERAFNVKEGVLQKYYGPVVERNFQVLTVLSRPRSVGELKLASNDPFEDPLMDPKYFQDEYDMKVLVEGVKNSVDLIEKSDAFKSVNGKLGGTVFPGCENVKYRSDAYWECFCRAYSLTCFHPVGTASMGKSEKTSVVDSRLKVHGIKNLRVADASVMPKIVTGNTNAPCILIGEMAADFILKTWSRETKTEL